MHKFPSPEKLGQTAIRTAVCGGVATHLKGLEIYGINKIEKEKTINKRIR